MVLCRINLPGKRALSGAGGNSVARKTICTEGQIWGAFRL